MAKSYTIRDTYKLVNLFCAKAGNALGGILTIDNPITNAEEVLHRNINKPHPFGQLQLKVYVTGAIQHFYYVDIGVLFLYRWMPNDVWKHKYGGFDDKRDQRLFSWQSC